MRRGLLVSIFVVLALAVVQPSLSATCTQAEKTQRVAAANAYAKRMGAERKAYFKRHKSVAQRRAFVAKQRKKLASLRAAAACTVTQPQPPVQTPASATLTIGPSVPADRAALIKRGFDIATAYFPKIGAPATWRADVYVEGSVAEMERRDPNAGRFMPDGGGAYATRGTVYMVPAGSSYDSSSEVRHIENVVHEMFHTVQYALSPTFADAQSPDAIPPGGPVWLIEGAADYVGYRAVADAGVDAASFRNEMIEMTKGQYADVPLQSCATRGDQGRVGYAVYAEGFAAVERLATLKGIGAIIDFWSRVGKGATWTDAFQQAFGMSVEQFYSDFAAYRKTL